MSQAAAQAHGKLWRAIVRSAEIAGVVIASTDDSFRRWMTGTFDGGRHAFKVQGKSSEALLGWLAGLDEDTVALPGFTIASLTASTIVCQAGRTEAYLEAVTVVDHP